MPPTQMRGLVEEAITWLIDAHEWEQLKAIEAAERESLAKMSLVA